MKITRPVLLLATLFAVTMARADLTLDTDFGGDGRVDVDFDQGVDSARDVAIQADGKVVAVGLARQFQLPGPVEYSTAGLVRLLPNGTLDPVFGTGGVATLLPGGTPTEALFGADARAIVVLPDERLLLAGAWAPGGTAPGQVFVSILTAAGAPDTSFDGDGSVLLTLPGFFDPVAEAVAVQSDGRIIVAGFGDTQSGPQGFLLRLTTAGALDPTFAVNGIRVVPSPDPNSPSFGVRALAIGAGDAIVAAGGGGDAFVARFTANGAPDTGFGTNGLTFVELGPVSGGTGVTVDDGLGVTLQSDGRIVVAGVRTDSVLERSEAVLFRLTSGGVLDGNFGAGGITLLPSTTGTGAAFDVTVLSNDDLVVVGLGIPVIQVSRSGLAQATRAVTADREFLVGIRRFPDDRVVVAGESSQVARSFLVAVLESTPLVDEADTTPDAFTFTDTPGAVVPDSVQTSNAVTITGINAPTPVTVVGGTYRIGGGGFTDEPGIVQAGQTITVRHNASAIANGTANTTLTVGGVSDTFTSVTGAATAQGFDLGDVTNVPLWTFQTSQTITVTLLSGVDAPISITGDADSSPGFSIGCTGNFTSAPGRVANGTTLCVRHISSTAGNTVTETTLAIGGASDTFTSRTVNVDSVPDAFSFAPATGAPIDELVTSAAVTITGIGAGVQSLVQVENGEVSVGCNGSFTAGFTTIANGQAVCVRHRSSGSPAGSVTTTLRIATASASFTSTTANADLVPDRFDFVDQTGVALLEPVTSAPVTITGLGGPAQVTVSGQPDSSNGDSVSIGCTNTYTATPGRISNGQTLCVRHTSSGTSAGSVTTTVRVGGRTADFKSTARTADLVPNTFTIPPLDNVGLNTVAESAVITLSGIDGPAPIAVEANGQTGYAIGCTPPFRTTPGVIRPGETFCLRTFTPVEDDETVTRVVAIGPEGSAVEVDWVVTTGETQPDPFDFVDVINVRQQERATSQPVTITGITAPALITIDLGEYSINCREAWTQADGRIESGDTLCVRHITAPVLDESVESTVIIGGAYSCVPDQNLVLTTQGGRSVCVNRFTGQPVETVTVGGTVVPALRRDGPVTGATFTSLTSNRSFPGSSAVDPWTLAVLLLPLLARRRRGARRAA
jgi:uncharacterized delta-60 repeat protein